MIAEIYCKKSSPDLIENINNQYTYVTYIVVIEWHTTQNIDTEIEIYQYDF